ncbi:hypothetical protein BGZ51_006592 [Haplosporangium sp. Z 767]|nr:hypothetical protein BGZ51_006592 [Haplosporangium sp. Z 767]
MGINGFTMHENYQHQPTGILGHQSESSEDVEMSLATNTEDGPWQQQRQHSALEQDADRDSTRRMSFHSTLNEMHYRKSHAPSNPLNTNDSIDNGRAEPEPETSHHTLRTTQEPERKMHQRPPRLSGHGLSTFCGHGSSSSSTSNSNIPSPLASPITATANSLTALSISQSSDPYGFSGRDLTRITVPREKKTSRPYSIASTDSFVEQECKRDDYGQDIRHRSRRLSDPDSSNRHQSGTTEQLGASRNGNVQPLPSPSSSTVESSKSTLLSPMLKPASQLRVTLFNLVSTGYLPANTLAVFREHSAIVTAKGTLIPQMKEPDAMTIYPWLQSEYETPSAWATAMVKGGRTGKVAVNGWSAIKIPIQQDATLRAMFEGQGVFEVPLDILRKRYLADMVEGGPGQTESDPTQATAAKAAALDRKKRKRPSARPSETAELRISTQTRTSGQKAKSEKPRPRKRTMSDLSGMVSSALLQDRQLHFEAAGALFAMQDTPSSSAYGSFDRRSLKDRKPQRKSHRSIGFIPLESLARRRLEQSSKISALRIVKAWSPAPAASFQHSSSDDTQKEQCVVCGTSGDNTSHLSIPTNDQSSEQHSTPEDSKAELGHASAEKKPSLKEALRTDTALESLEWLCLDCRECVECGFRLLTEVEKDTANESTTRSSQPADDDYETPMIFCDGCSLWVHVACDKGLQESDYEELGEDSRKYFCPSCIPTPIPSPTHSSSSSMVSTINSVERSPWLESCSFSSHHAENSYGSNRDASPNNEDDWHTRGRRRKDDILDLIKAAKEISDSESQDHSPYSAYSPMFPSSHSRTVSASLESVAEVAAAEALLTIFSGASTPEFEIPLSHIGEEDPSHHRGTALNSLFGLQGDSTQASSNRSSSFQQLTGQVVHARKCYKQLFFIDLRLNDQEKCTILFRSDDQRENLPSQLSTLDLVSCWKRIKRGDTICLQVFEASEEESSKRNHPVFQAVDFTVIKAWPGDDPFPSEPAMGLKEPIASPTGVGAQEPTAAVTTTKATAMTPSHTKEHDNGSVMDSWEDYCKFWINSQRCLKPDCRKQHPTGEEYARIQEIWVKERTQARKERSKLQDDPHSISSKVPHSRRAFIFCQWLVNTFGKDFLNSGSGVLDVAGGKGEISLFLTHMFGIRSTVVEPSMRRDKPYQRRNLLNVIRKQLDIEAGGDGQFYNRTDQALPTVRSMGPAMTLSEVYGLELNVGHNQESVYKERRRLKKRQEEQFVVPRLCTVLDDQFPQSHPGIIESASILIGMHPDQATEPIVTMALRYNKPFAIVPCCVFAHENPHRRLVNGGEVNTTLEFIQYLMEKTALDTASRQSMDPLDSAHKEFLPFDGMNIVVFRKSTGI